MNKLKFTFYRVDGWLSTKTSYSVLMEQNKIAFGMNNKSINSWFTKQTPHAEKNSLTKKLNFVVVMVTQRSLSVHGFSFRNIYG